MRGGEPEVFRMREVFEKVGIKFGHELEVSFQFIDLSAGSVVTPTEGDVE